MHNGSAYVKDFKKREINRYLPPFIGDFSEQLQVQQQQAMAIIQINNKPDAGAIQKKVKGNPCWIAVSGYQPDRAYLVYLFFLDIGHIVDKSFTETNLMYLKYYCMMDCEIALSYDGQKVGYAGDILVHVKKENPVLLDTIIESIHAESVQVVQSAHDCQAKICVIDIETAKLQEPEVIEETIDKVVHENRQGIVKKLGFIGWLKHKLSYLFYFRQEL